MALGQTLDDVWSQYMASQLAPPDAVVPEQQDLTVVPVSPSQLGNPEPPKPPPPPPPPVQQIGATPVQTEIAGPRAPAPQPFSPFDLGPPDAITGVGEPLREPDAITAAGGPPEVATPAETVPDPSLGDLVSRAAQGLGFDAREPSMPDDYILGNEDPEAGARELNALPPERRAAVLENYEAGRMRKAKELEQRALEERAAKSKAEEAAAQRHVEMQRRAHAETQALLAEARDIANTKIKPETGTARHVLMGILGGLIQGRTGSATNAGLDMVNKEIERDIALQKENLANRRAGLSQRQNLLGELLARTGDIEKAETAFRIAHYDAVIDGLTTEMGKYDPKGSQIVDLVAMRDKAAAQRAQVAQQLYDKNLDRQIKIGKYELEGRRQGLEEAKFGLDVDKENARRAELARKQALAGAGGGGVKHDPSYFASLQLPKPPIPMTDKEHHAWMLDLKLGKELGGNDAQSRKQVAEAQEAEAKAAAAKEGYAIKDPQTGKVITNPDGSPVVEMDATKRNKTSDIMAAATNIRRLADRMRALKEKDGGHWKVLGSDEAQEIQSLVSSLDFETFKAFGLGAPSEGDKALAEGVRGGVDPSSFVKNASAGFQAYADNVEKKALTELRNSGYRGTTFKFTRASDLPRTQISVDEQRFKSLNAPPNISADAADSQARKLLKPYYDKWNTLSDDEKGAVRTELHRLTANWKEISPQQYSDLLDLAAKANRGDPTARAHLDQLRAAAPTGAIQLAAQQALGGVLQPIGPSFPKATPAPVPQADVQPNANLPPGLDPSRFGGGH